MGVYPCQGDEKKLKEPALISGFSYTSRILLTDTLDAGKCMHAVSTLGYSFRSTQRNDMDKHAIENKLVSTIVLLTEPLF